MLRTSFVVHLSCKCYNHSMSSNKKYGTNGHIVKDDTYNPFYYKPTDGISCIYKSDAGICTKTGFINNGLYCKKPGACHHYCSG